MTRRTAASVATVLLFAVVCVSGLGYLVVNMGLEVPGAQRGWRLEASFAATEGLVPLADVDVSGVRVGKVRRVALDGQGGSLVTMLIDGDVHLRQDVKAYVRPKSPIGEQCVELVRRPSSGAPWAPDGYRIPRQRTGQSVQLDSILNSLDPQTRAAFSSTLRELGVGVEGRAQDISSTIPGVGQAAANLRPIARTADRRQREIDQILKDLAVIIGALADEQDALGRIIDSGDSALGAVNARDQQLAGTLRQADHLLVSLDFTFSDLTPADRASLEKGPPTIQSTRTLLSTLNPEVDRLLPELLLAQVDYPNNQLSVSHPRAVSLAYEWISAFAQNDANGHSFRITGVVDPATAVRLPLQLPVLNGVPATPPTRAGGGGGATPPDATPAPATSAPAPPSVVQLLMGLPT
jgi:virulence factor Mce-like protein